MRRDEVTKDLVLLLQTETVLVAAGKHCSGLCVPDAPSIRVAAISHPCAAPHAALRAAYADVSWSVSVKDS